MVSMATMTVMARARTKASQVVTATKTTETVTKVTVKKVIETSTGTVIVTAKTMSRIMTTEVAMEWNVTLWIRMVRMRLQLTETSTAMLTATVTEKASGTLIAKKIASTTDTANVTPTVRAVVAMTEKAIGKAIGQLIATTT